MTTLAYFIQGAPVAASLEAQAEAVPVGLAGLLQASGWRGLPVEVAESLGREPLSFDRACSVARLLGLSARLRRLRVEAALRSGFPCMIEGPGEKLLVILPQGEELVCVDAMSGAEAAVPALRRRVRCVTFSLPEGLQPRWSVVLRGLTGRGLSLVIGMAAAINLLGLALPLFTLAVYDQALAADDLALLALLGLGLGIALVGDLGLRVLRAVMLGHLAGRVDLAAVSDLVGKMLRLPPELADRLSPMVARGRLREWDAIRSFFFGPLSLACIEVPFVAGYLLALVFLAGWLTLAPVLVLVLGLCLSLWLLRRARRGAMEAMAAVSAFQSLQNEMIDMLRPIKEKGAEPLWLARYRQASANYARAGLVEARVSATAQVAAQSITTFCAVATLATGATMALSGHLSVGGLIAAMALIWRMLSPLGMVLTALARIRTVRGAVGSLDGLMASPEEFSAQTKGAADNIRRGTGGRVGFAGTLFSYPGGAGPVLQQISFEVKPGELVAITGPNGAGKSTVLKLILGLYRPQFGAVLLDQTDLRQITPRALRHSLAYAPQEMPDLPISVAEFLRLGSPAASDMALEDACERAGIRTEVEDLAQGFATPLARLAGAEHLRSGLRLARAWLLDAKLVLLDEPDVSRPECRRALLAELERIRGKQTVLLVTHDSQLASACDRVIALRQGSIIFDGTPRDLAARLESAAR
ncbi:peptidase domain-containing ABC transporter [Roseomonas sp. 18066]|uniref:peptidase domain-containing ABC transporter n=1 Tax=Roseomonas sp. 18066 TaxID=2681412 RepID=UPI00135B9F82|nr:ATP-binding cassette domain-containing protein [Roseomonas sp. 18066]